ncbi:rho guanine nucleotide exchange factor 18a isoform X2 [Parambassis ranga]|uniref:Rho guanine nucleotide exchange factor 18a isoform X2 n=1 Tax=Parambassis ranga TaxID=210632 RepID=A0A6P7K0K5_9TELE|nr:rho guanine nucleotide exchange factor 18-like isoform X2 [Parambassis ranga]
MDDVDGPRFRPEDTVSLASSLAEPINLEDSYYALLRGELEFDAQNLEADSWSLAVDQNYLKVLNKEAIKRQDVMYELIQTEMHHVRTLKILLHVYMYELKRSFLIEEARLEQLFPGVDSLLSLHQDFLNMLKLRQAQSQEEGSPNNYYITQLGDILIAQFSGLKGQQMMESYSEFCSHHGEANSFYKEQMQNNKKLQILIKKIGQLPLVRRLGVPECFLLVTQRITKYPVLVERIIQNTEADTEEHRSLVEGLGLIKNTISQVNTQVSVYEKVARLREISLRLEPKCGRMKDGGMFQREDLLNEEKRTLLHEGNVTWKSPGRQKDIYAVLLSDVLLLLQEKDQKLVFAALENKPPVISLRELIVREVAHEDKAMYLICTSTSSVPEMYEIHTGSKEERATWTQLIREAADCHRVEELYSNQIKRLQQFEDNLKLRDEQIRHMLWEKQQIFAALYEEVTEQEAPHKGLLLRGDMTDLQQGETLLNGAINEVEILQNLFFLRMRNLNPSELQEGPLRRSSTCNDNSVGSIMKNGDAVDQPDGSDQQQERFYTEGPEESADDTDCLPVPNSSTSSSHLTEPEVCDRLIMLAQRLYSLQAIVTQQDTQIELQHALKSKSSHHARHYSSVLLEQEKQRNLEKQKEEIANVHKLQAQHREEQQRWEKERERQRIQIEALEAQVQQREEECRKWEEKLNEEKAELERQKEDYQQRLERLRETTKSVEKKREQIEQERERLEKVQERLKLRYNQNPGHSNYDDPAQSWSLQSYPSFRGSTVNGGANLTLSPHAASEPLEIPPKVPPRKESISPQPAKPEMPVHLISTTNQVHKPAAVQQQIPTKLASLSKGKEKGVKAKGSHQRTQSAASIDVNQVLPIRVTGKEGGSLRAKRNASPQRILHSETFRAPGPAHNIKTSQSFSTNKWSSEDPPPPAPPPFPKEVLEKGKEKGREKVIFL